jgi:hypothetical protein
MTSVHVAAKAMATSDGWDSDGSLSWEDFFGKKMNDTALPTTFAQCEISSLCGIYGQLRPLYACFL